MYSRFYFLKFRSTPAGFLAVVGHSWDLDQKRSGTRPVLISQTEIGTELQKLMILQLTTESGHPRFRACSAFERRDLGSKGHGKKPTQFNDNEGNIELLLRTVISVNQLSIYALADLCKELNKKSFEDSADNSPEDSFRKLRNTLCERNIQLHREKMMP